MTLVEVALGRAEVEFYVTSGVIEFLEIVRVLALLLIFYVLIVSFVGVNSYISSALGIFGDVNLVTATLVVMFSPVLRSLIGGLTVLSDRFIKAGQAVELCGIVPLGRILAVQLRETKIRAFKDGAVYHIPNILFLRFPIVNGSVRGPQREDRLKETIGVAETPSKTAATTLDVVVDEDNDVPLTTTMSTLQTTRIKVKFPISYDTDLAALRNLISTQCPNNVSVVLDDDLHIIFQKDKVLVSEVDSERTKLMLDMMSLIHQNKVELRF